MKKTQSSSTEKRYNVPSEKINNMDTCWIQMATCAPIEDEEIMHILFEQW